MKKKYRDLLRQYPEYITKEQLYKICHMSKETAKYYLDTGLIPSTHNGKKTRCYTIAMTDVIAFLEDREANPEKYRLPRSAWSRIRRPDLPAKPEGYRGSLFSFYREHFAGEPDVLSVDGAVYGDNVIEKRGKGRDNVGIREKTLYSYGTAAVVRRGRSRELSTILRRERRRELAFFSFAQESPGGRRTARGEASLRDIRRPPEAAQDGHFRGFFAMSREGKSREHSPRKSQQQTKKAGVAALEDSIAAGAGFSNMARRANAALERAEMPRKQGVHGRIAAGGALLAR